MKVRVDASKCQAYGICNEIAPRVFELDEWGYAAVPGQGDIAAKDEESARRAENSCPAHAVVVHQE